MTPGRKPPHCKTCHKPLKGHKRDVCELTDEAASPNPLPPSPSVSAKTQKTAPPLVERLPTLSTESSQILNDILRANSHSAPSIQVPGLKQSEPRRRSGRVAKRGQLLREALECVSADEEQKPGGEQNGVPLTYNESLALPVPGAWKKESIPQVQSHISTPTPSSSCAVSQQLVVQTSNEESSLVPLTKTMSRQLKLEDSPPSGSCSHHPQQFASSDVPSADLTIQNFLDSMARNPQHPPATIFSYPTDSMGSLEDSVRSHGLCMHILSLPNSKGEWAPVVIGRDTSAITQLLEDGEKLAKGLRRPDKFKVHEFDLGMSHVMVGALGALATWAGLAYS